MHVLFAIEISLGFLIGYHLKLKKPTALILIFLFAGLAIGMNQHLYQDSLEYQHDTFMNNIVYVQERTVTPWKEALCLVWYNNNTVCDKYKEND